MYKFLLLQVFMVILLVSCIPKFEIQESWIPENTSLITSTPHSQGTLFMPKLNSYQGIPLDIVILAKNPSSEFGFFPLAENFQDEHYPVGFGKIDSLGNYNMNLLDEFDKSFLQTPEQIFESYYFGTLLDLAKTFNQYNRLVAQQLENTTDGDISNLDFTDPFEALINIFTNPEEGAEIGTSLVTGISLIFGQTVTEGFSASNSCQYQVSNPQTRLLYSQIKFNVIDEKVVVGSITDYLQTSGESNNREKNQVYTFNLDNQPVFVELTQEQEESYLDYAKRLRKTVEEKRGINTPEIFSDTTFPPIYSTEDTFIEISCQPTEVEDNNSDFNLDTVLDMNIQLKKGWNQVGFRVNADWETSMLTEEPIFIQFTASPISIITKNQFFFNSYYERGRQDEIQESRNEGNLLDNLFYSIACLTVTGEKPKFCN